MCRELISPLFSFSLLLSRRRRLCRTPPCCRRHLRRETTGILSSSSLLLNCRSQNENSKFHFFLSVQSTQDFISYSSYSQTIFPKISSSSSPSTRIPEAEDGIRACIAEETRKRCVWKFNFEVRRRENGMRHRRIEDRRRKRRRCALLATAMQRGWRW